MEDDLRDRIAVLYAEEPCDATGPESGVQRNGTYKEFSGPVRAGFQTNFCKDDGAIRKPFGLRVREHVASDDEVIDLDCH